LTAHLHTAKSTPCRVQPLRSRCRRFVNKAVPVPERLSRHAAWIAGADLSSVN